MFNERLSCQCFTTWQSYGNIIGAFQIAYVCTKYLRFSVHMCENVCENAIYLTHSKQFSNLSVDGRLTPSKKYRICDKVHVV